MSNQENNIITMLKECQAMQKGHFILSSGLHSEYYIQCAKIFETPSIATKLCSLLAKKIKNSININDIDTIVSPAMGGVIVGYEIAKQLNKKSLFCERVDGKFTLRRNFQLKPNERVLVIEDVLTTGKSSLETFECINSYNANIIAEACIINRSNTTNPIGKVPLISLIEINAQTFDNNNIPEHLKNTIAIKPGSRFIKQT